MKKTESKAVKKNKANVMIVNAASENHGRLIDVTNRVIRELSSSGANVTLYNLHEHPIGFCTDCRACCRVDGKFCNHDNNFNRFAEMLMETDVVVFSVPVLWNTPPAVLQVLLDKFQAFASTKAISNGVDIDNKKWVFIGESTEPQEIMDYVRENIWFVLETFSWKPIGNICCFSYDPDFHSAIEQKIKSLVAIIINCEVET